jgi:hypothetical protein
METRNMVNIDSIVAAATDYANSFYVGDATERAKRIERVLHRELAKRSPSFFNADGTFYHWGVPEMIRLAADSVNEHPEQHKLIVKVLDVCGNMASVRLEANWGVDYLHLAKLDGEWKVINVLWDKPCQ